MAGLLFMACKTEERSILEGAGVIWYTDVATTPVTGSALIDGNFLTSQGCQKGTYLAPETGNYLGIVLDKQREVRTVLITNKATYHY